LIDLITHINIEDINRKELQTTWKKEMITKANLVEMSSHKKRYNNNKSKVTIPICSNPKPTILIKREIVLCVANLTTMHFNAEIERETIILLKLRSLWLKEKTSLLRLFLKSIW
jgi:hypothetical protein